MKKINFLHQRPTLRVRQKTPTQWSGTLHERVVDGNDRLRSRHDSRLQVAHC